MTLFQRGDRVRFTAQAVAAGRQPAGELGTICQAVYPRGMSVRVLWDRHGSRSGLRCSRELIEKVEPKGGDLFTET
jgi:hypothetical protein